MSDTYIERIVKLIAQHRQEIERLEIALSVMGELMEQDPHVKHKPKAMAETTTPITIRRIAAPQPRPEPESEKPPAKKKTRTLRADKTQLRNQLMASLKTSGPQTSTVLIAEMFPKGSSKQQKQMVYGIMNDWLHQGVVIRRNDRTYAVVEQTSH